MRQLIAQYKVGNVVWYWKDDKSAVVSDTIRLVLPRPTEYDYILEHQGSRVYHENELYDSETELVEHKSGKEISQELLDLIKERLQDYGVQEKDADTAARDILNILGILHKQCDDRPMETAEPALPLDGE